MPPKARFSFRKVASKIVNRVRRQSSGRSFTNLEKAAARPPSMSVRESALAKNAAATTLQRNLRNATLNKQRARTNKGVLEGVKAFNIKNRRNRVVSELNQVNASRAERRNNQMMGAEDRPAKGRSKNPFGSEGTPHGPSAMRDSADVFSSKAERAPTVSRSNNPYAPRKVTTSSSGAQTETMAPRTTTSEMGTQTRHAPRRKNVSDQGTQTKAPRRKRRRTSGTTGTQTPAIPVAKSMGTSSSTGTSTETPASEVTKPKLVPSGVSKRNRKGGITDRISNVVKKYSPDSYTKLILGTAAGAAIAKAAADDEKDKRKKAEDAARARSQFYG